MDRLLPKSDTANSLIVNGKMILYGFVGGDGIFEEGFTSSQVMRDLATLSGPLDVHVNSGGGNAWDGVAIYNHLRAYANEQGKVTVYVDAIAASAASVIAMAGDEIVMRTGSMMMIHNASSVSFGTKEDHEKPPRPLPFSMIGPRTFTRRARVNRWQRSRS